MGGLSLFEGTTFLCFLVEPKENHLLGGSNLLWMDEILHHFETMESQFLLVSTRIGVYNTFAGKQGTNWTAFLGGFDPLGSA